MNRCSLTCFGWLGLASARHGRRREGWRCPTFAEHRREPATVPLWIEEGSLLDRQSGVLGLARGIGEHPQRALRMNYVRPPG